MKCCEVLFVNPEPLSFINAVMILPPNKGRRLVLWGRRLAKVWRVSSLLNLWIGLGYQPGALAILGSNPSGPTTNTSSPIREYCYLRFLNNLASLKSQTYSKPTSTSFWAFSTFLAVAFLSLVFSHPGLRYPARYFFVSLFCFKFKL